MSESADDKLHLGAPEIAKRVFGSDAEKYCRIVYHWRSLPAERRPPFLIDVAGRPAAWESAIRRSADDRLAGAA